MRKLLPGLLLLLCLWAFPHATVNAATPSFTVQAVPAATQLTKDVAYFQLLTKPNQAQTIAVKITNLTNGSHRFKVAVNRAGTGANGQLDYRQHGAVEANSLNHDIEALFEPPKTVVLAPRTSRTVTMRFTAPKATYAGIILGGLRVTQTDQQDTAVAYTLPVQLQAAPKLTHLPPRLSFDEVIVHRADSGVALSAVIQNPLPMIQAGVKLTASVYRRGKQAPIMTKRLTAKMAPNSQLTLPVNALPKNLAAGKYDLVVQASVKNASWRFSKPFTLRQAKQNPTRTAATTASLPRWLIGGLIAIVLALLGVIAALRRKRR